MRLVRQAILGESHVLVYAVCAVIDPYALYRRVESGNAFQQLLHDRIEMRTSLKILVLVAVEPLLVVVRLQLPEEIHNRFHIRIVQLFPDICVLLLCGVLLFVDVLRQQYELF